MLNTATDATGELLVVARCQNLKMKFIAKLVKKDTAIHYILQEAK